MYKISGERPIDSEHAQDQSQGNCTYCGLDIDKYLPYAEDWDMTLEQKREALKSVAAIIQHFVDQAWDTSDKT